MSRRWTKKAKAMRMKRREWGGRVSIRTISIRCASTWVRWVRGQNAKTAEHKAFRRPLLSE